MTAGEQRYLDLQRQRVILKLKKDIPLTAHEQAIMDQHIREMKAEIQANWTESERSDRLLDKLRR